MYKLHNLKNHIVRAKNNLFTKDSNFYNDLQSRLEWLAENTQDLGGNSNPDQWKEEVLIALDELQKKAVDKIETAVPSVTDLLDSAYDLAVQNYKKLTHEITAYRPTSTQLKVAGAAGSAVTILAAAIYLNKRRKKQEEKVAPSTQDS